MRSILIELALLLFLREMLKTTVLYHSYLLLYYSICGKIFERLIYNAIYDFLSGNNLLTPNQSGFRSGNSCINQLFSINQEILNAFDKGHEVRGILLDISKVFDKVWHDGLIFKLCRNDISRDIINILRGFLCNRKQRAVLNGQCSSWADVHGGVPQESISVNTSNILITIYKTSITHFD